MNLNSVRNLFNGGPRDWLLNQNELSGWSRLAAPALLWYASWRRSLKQLLGIGGFVAASPYVFPASTNDTWMNRALLGERRWIVEKRTDPAAEAFCFGGGVAVALGMLLALLRKFWPSLFFAVGGGLLSAWHFDRMAARFEREREREAQLDFGEQTAERQPATGGSEDEAGAG
ncbi:MAG: hypothetical protein MAG453_00368 [Calditrichaeota bacterium]|nr:hypothetical protein [Calditrichota bacterium]